MLDVILNNFVSASDIVPCSIILGNLIVFTQKLVSNKTIGVFSLILPVCLKVSISNNSNPSAPGQLDKHYATGKPTHLVGQPYELLQFNQDNVFTIGYGEGLFDFNLSPTSILDEMAQQLFTALRQADDSERNEIAICKAPDVGIGKAINDRMTRAAR